MVDPCPRCGSGDIHRWEIPHYGVVHCQCINCEKEWIE